MPQVRVLFVFVKKIEKNHTPVADVTAGPTMFRQFFFLPSDTFHTIDRSTGNLSAPHTFEPSVVRTMHAAIGIAGCFKQTFNNLSNTLVTRRIALFDFLELLNKLLGRVKVVSAHNFTWVISTWENITRPETALPSFTLKEEACRHNQPLIKHSWF